MSWDPTVQFMGTFIGGRVEQGEATLGTDGTVEVATKLAKLRSAFVTSKSGRILATQCMCDLAITAGAVTIADPAAHVNAGGKVNYLFIGQ